MAASPLALIVGLLQLGLWLLLFAAGLHLLRSAAWAWGRPLDPAPAKPLANPPLVTVQLPIRNELFVAERVLRATAALDWPRDRLQIQVLDDSDDETVARVDAVAAELRQAGHDIEVIRRPDRIGFKAGALQLGLATAKGEWVAILDADCVPPADFLRRLIPPLLADPKLAFTQARWSFDNESAGVLERAQALILHGLMLVEQSRLSDQALPLQFNGTGGVWRRSALEAAGGWLGRKEGTASVTEDLDLSYRVGLAGFRGRQLPEVAVQTELPSTMAAFRTQQQRWVRGGGEVLRALAGRVLRGTAPPGARLTMLAHLLRHARQPYLVLAALWLPLVALGDVQPAFAIPYAGTVMLSFVLFAVGAYYAAALRRLGRSPLLGFALAPVIVALSLGLTVTLATSLLRGVFGRAAAFVRTPKTGGTAGGYRASLDWAALVEVALGLVYVAVAAIAASQAQWPAALTFLALFAAGFLWVGVGALSR